MRTIQTVEQLLKYAVEHFATKDFCRFLQNDEIRCKTYQDFFNDCTAMRNYILEKNAKHKHIAFVGKTNYEYIVCLTAIILSGNVAIPFAPDIATEEAIQLFADADVSMLFCEEDFLEKAAVIKNEYTQLGDIHSLGNSEWYADIFCTYAVSDVSNSCVSAAPDDCAMIIFTSGTTGDRKGVMLSNKNLAHNSTYDTYRMEDDDVSFSILPMHHVFCYACDVLKTMYDGGTLCLNGNLADLYKNLLIFEPTIMRIVPAVCKSMLTKIKIIEKRNPQLSKRDAAERIVGKNFRRMIAGSAFLSVAMIDEFEKYGICARQGYGMSECSPRITTSDFSDVCKYSNGILLGIDEVRVVDGEIQVRGDSVMLGYYNKPQATADVFTADGFLQTGDLGYIDDGHVYLVGRKKNLIILSNGENISPEEIENRFADYALIREILVFADGDSIIAEVFPNAELFSELSAEETELKIGSIIDEVNISMPTDRQIQSFRIRTTPFARTSTGKIKRTSFYYTAEK